MPLTRGEDTVPATPVVEPAEATRSYPSIRSHADPVVRRLTHQYWQPLTAVSSPLSNFARFSSRLCLTWTMQPTPPPPVSTRAEDALAVTDHILYASLICLNHTRVIH